MIAALAAGVSLKFPSAHPRWFFISASAAVICLFLDSIRSRGGFKAGLFFSAAVVWISGAAISHPFLRFLYMPFFTGISAFFGPPVFLPAWASLLLAESRGICRLKPESVFSAGAALVCGGSAWLAVRGLRAKTLELRQELHEFRDSPQSPASGLPDASAGELAGALRFIKAALGADALTLFLAKGDGLAVRGSTASGTGLRPGGLIWLCYQKGQSIIGELKGQEAGYDLGPGQVSLIAVPVMEDRVVLGALAANSARPGAFGDGELETLEEASGFLSAMLKAERIQTEKNRRLSGFESLKEESSRLLNLLDPDMVAKEAINGILKIAPVKAAFFIKGRDGYRPSGLYGLQKPEEKFFPTLKGTLLENAIRNREHLYLSDLSSYRIPPLPFAAGRPRAALMAPLIYEDETLGALALLSEEKDPLTAYQVELVKLLSDQLSLALSRALLHERVKLLATTDGLTGLFNHRHFQERLSGEFRRIARYPRPLSLLIIDIDFFKKVNDNYGHPAGDAVLKGVADAIRKALRETDIPARYGGEEFAAVLVNTDTGGAVNLAERLRNTISGCAFQADGKNMRVTVSIGVASCPVHAQTREELVKLADTALYRAKNGGRNRVEVAG